MRIFVPIRLYTHIYIYRKKIPYNNNKQPIGNNKYYIIYYNSNNYWIIVQYLYIYIVRNCSLEMCLLAKYRYIVLYNLELNFFLFCEFMAPFYYYYYIIYSCLHGIYLINYILYMILKLKKWCQFTPVQSIPILYIGIMVPLPYVKE